MFNIPQLKYTKPHNKKLQYTKTKRNIFQFNKYAIYAKSSGFLYLKQIEACRKILRRKLGKKSKIKIHMYPNMPYSSKPRETRMGRGKGANFKWLTQISAGSLLFSLTGVTFNINETNNIISNKLPIHIKIIEKKQNKIINKHKKNKNNLFLYV